MKDGTRELTNNQWLLKADADKLPATYAELVTLLTGAGLPFGRTLLSDGWTIEPDPLNKANFLPDAVAALYGLTSTAQIKDVLNAIEPRLFQSASWATNGWAEIGEFIVQWGTTICGNAASEITLPIEFPTAAMFGIAGSGADVTYWAYCSAISTTKITIGFYDTSGTLTQNVRWLAIGH